MVGASIGLLAAVGYLAADLPGSFAGYPEIFIALVMLCGALIGLFAWTPIASAASILAGAVTAIVIAAPVIDGPVHSWIRRDSLTTAPLDAVVVLSAGMNADGVLDAAGTERLVSGLEIANRNRSRLLVTTRIEAHDSPSNTSSDADQRALIGVAGDTAKWLVAAPVHTTHDEAVRTAALLAPAAGRTIAVVTSPIHTRRACATFEAVGFHVVCTPSDERRFAVYSLRGQNSRVHALAEYVYERLAMVEYRARGWVR